MSQEHQRNEGGIPAAGGYTLVELVSVITILSIVGLVTSGVIVESMKIYARTVPAMDASYQAKLAAKRMKLEVRDMLDTDSITTFTATALTFDDSSNNTIAYALVSGDLLRNTDVLARGMTSLVIQYWQKDGTIASDAADIHLVEVDLTVETGTEAQRLQFAVFPRVLGSLGTGSGPGSALSSSPIAHWDLNESSGTTAADTVAGNDGTMNGGVTLGVSGTPSGDTAVAFDGTDDYVAIPHSSDYMLDDGTIQFWFRADSVSGTQVMLSKDSSGYDTGGHVLVKLSGDNVEVRLQSTTTSYYLDSGSLISTGTWYHVAFTFGSAGMQLYVNASLVDTDTYTGGLGTTSGGSGNMEPMVFGSSTWSSDDGLVTPLVDYYDGSLDAVAIYNVALSAADIQALYDDGGALN